ncbi:MAG: flagellar hook-basal body complex protein FliE [Candidatus Eremiobacteraeota bacterium]|nr:flagellar hook-basal body complex protein FliE [Candidatus Eremiobacteraeota bacterium]
MKVELLSPDAAPSTPRPSADASQFARALDAVGSLLTDAKSSEDAFANGAGSLQSAVYERARADVALSVATAAAQRSAQALTAILNMQI